MQTEKEKSLHGKLYKASDKELFTERQFTKELIFRFNSLPPSEVDSRNEIIRQLFCKTGEKFIIEPPFHCDYGSNITIGNNFYSNFNLVILDCAQILIGDNVLIGPDVGIYAASHPVHHELRSQEYEFAFPVYIGNDVWIGGNAVINPGITIGDNSVIGSGSVVTRDIPANVVAAGNPCRVIREISAKDKIYYFRNFRV
ncbi:MAG: sugar O-acetyltransferase [Bacteroidales bacterium]|nr:sugar O-acetyltransferase [Bacteroidales bacterium]